MQQHSQLHRNKIQVNTFQSSAEPLLTASEAGQGSGRETHKRWSLKWAASAKRLTGVYRGIASTEKISTIIDKAKSVTIKEKQEL